VAIVASAASKKNKLKRSEMNQRKEHHTIPLERLDSINARTSPDGNLSASQIDPFYTQGEDFDPASDLDDTWVTVFGFPSDSANYILKEFSTYGTIVQHEFASKGNWVHIRYQSAMQAKKALSKNGHLYAQNTIRIGVSPCIDKDIMRRQRRKTVLSADSDDVTGSKRMKISDSKKAPPTKSDMTPVSSLLFSRIDSTSTRPNPLPAIPSRLDNSIVGSPNDSLNRSARLNSMRSLAAAYDGNRTSTLLNRSEIPPTTPDGNLLTKAWKYIFSM